MNINPDNSSSVDLTGGNSGRVQRIGDTVRRQAGPWTPTVHRLLRGLRDQGLTEVPVPLSIEGDEEVLSFISGDVANYPLPDWLWNEGILVGAFELLRRLHDATSKLNIEGGIWQLPTHEPQEVICHNDFAPYNLVFNNSGVVGVIDFDTASPGPRIWDFAYLAYRLIPFGTDAGEASPAIEQRVDRLKLAIASYGLDSTVDQVLDIMSARLIELAEFTEKHSKSSANTELLGHAAMYRADAQTIRESHL